MKVNTSNGKEKMRPIKVNTGILLRDSFCVIKKDLVSSNELIKVKLPS